MTAFGEEAYPTPFLKAAAIAEAIVCMHVFNDGNHRTALTAAYVVLGLYDLRLLALESELKETIYSLENKRLSLEEFGNWLEERCIFRSRVN
jgi:death on curing protein